MTHRIMVALVGLVLTAAGCRSGWVDIDTRAPAGGVSAPDIAPDIAADLPDASELERRLIAYFPCASSPWSPGNPHHMSYGLEEPGGWDRFYSTHVREAIERFGYRRVFFHLPFGKTTGQSPREMTKRRTGRDDASLERWHMSLDHEHDLRRTGNEHISRGFYSAMGRLHAAHPGVEVIVYVGSMDDEDKAFMARFGEDALLDRWKESLRPLVELDYVSIVFDAAVSYGPNEPNAKIVKWAHEAKRRQPGRFVGVEARIQKARPWPNELCLPVVAWEDVFRKQGHSRNIATEDLCAPALRVIDGRARADLLKGRDGDAQGWIELAADIVADGHVPVVGTIAGRRLDRTTYRLPEGRTVRLPSTAAEGPFRLPADQLAVLLVAAVEQRGG
ncbi:MAG: hypothetical protein RIB60_07095 [Phycisphaerales bacterium]